LNKVFYTAVVSVHFEVLFLIPIYVREQAKHNKSLGRQMIKVLARLTNRAEQFCTQRSQF